MSLSSNIYNQLPQGLNNYVSKIRSSVSGILITNPSFNISDNDIYNIENWSTSVKNGLIYIPNLTSLDVVEEDPATERDFFGREHVVEILPPSYVAYLELSEQDSRVAMQSFDGGGFKIWFWLDGGELLSVSVNDNSFGFDCNIQSDNSLIREENYTNDRLRIYLSNIEQIKYFKTHKIEFSLQDLIDESKIQLEVVQLTTWTGINTVTVKVTAAGCDVETIGSTDFNQIDGYFQDMAGSIISLSHTGNGVYTIGIRDTSDGDSFEDGDSILFNIENNDYVSQNIVIERNGTFETTGNIYVGEYNWINKDSYKNL